MTKARLSMSFCVARDCPNFKPRETKKKRSQYFGATPPPAQTLRVCSITNKFPRDMAVCPFKEPAVPGRAEKDAP